MARKAPTRSPGPDELSLSPEVHWYLLDRKIGLPDCPPTIRTPEPRTVRGAQFDPERVDRVLNGFGVLRHTQGQLAGRPLKPDPWQVAYIIAPVFGWVKRNEKRRWVRIITTLYVDVPRKNGKTTLSGGLAIYLTAGDGEAGAQVIAAATTKEQAGFCFAPIKHLAEHAPGLKGHVRPLAGKILHPASASYFQVVSSVAEAQHGANLHGGIVDELHVHKTGELLEAIETGTGSREQPLIVIITTADDGRPGTVYARKRHYVEQLAGRVLKDPSTYGVIWCADAEDDPHNPDTWKKCNPGLGVSPTMRYLRDASTKAKNSPADLASFKRLHLGIRTRQDAQYIQLDTWDASAGIVDETDLAGARCHGGLDLSSVEDLTALCWTFPGDDEFRALWRFWLPADRFDSLNRRTAGEAEVWVREGRLELTPGNVIDNDMIRARINADAKKFDVQTIGFDRWNAADLIRRLGEEDGFTCVPVSQSYGTISSPVKEILRLCLAKKYRHGGNPVMRWMISNLAVDMDSHGNVKPAKNKAAEKIDGFSAAATAMREVLDVAVVEEAPEPRIRTIGG